MSQCVSEFTFTRDKGLASGNQVVSGLGFKPRVVIFFMAYSSATTLDLKDKSRKEKPFIRFRCMRDEHTDGQHRHWGITPEEINYEVNWDVSK